MVHSISISISIYIRIIIRIIDQDEDMEVKERMEELALDTEDASERVAKAR